MDLFKNGLMKRVALWKTIGLVGWIIGFFTMPLVFTEADTMLKFALLLWYITLWAFVWVFGVRNDMPIFKVKIPYWARWIWIWAWMNFVLALFIYDELAILMSGTMLDWCSPFRIVLEWAIFWLFVDYIATKYVWEGKKLMK